MNSEKYISVLGKYFGEPEITSFLSEWGIREKPKLKRGDDTTFLSAPPKGIELTFETSETVTTSARDYPEGALVLCNIRFYGVEADDFSPFKGELPFNVKFGDDKQKLISQLGKPAWLNPSFTLIRWDVPNVSMFASLDKKERVETFEIQLPVK